MVCTHITYLQEKVLFAYPSPTEYDIPLLKKDDLHFLKFSNNSSIMEAIIGEVIVVVLDTYVGSGYEIQFMYRNKKIISVPLLEKDKKQFAFVGIPHGMLLGSYSLILVPSSSKDNAQDTIFSAKQVILLKERNNFKELVSLNRTLSKRRVASSSKIVIDQANDMWKLTGTVFEDDYFVYDNFIFPLETYKYFSGMYSDERVFVNEAGNIVDSSIHGGIDIAASMGTPILAPARGRIVFAGERVVTGKTIVISHFPGLYSLLYHLNDIQVEVNDRVEVSTVIGTVGNSGFSTGPHLHWELRVNNVRVDPILSMGVLDKVFILAVE